ncbi:terminase gpA endonuclease subunit [Anatilimnocola sp. NA78]|uniref:terminase gpA endonuclease subunit n=1 Tax=Anatilimnocola sp. NA78 TaxID=3415683 RepID=UPI003CE4F925
MEKIPELRNKAKKLRHLLQQVESVPGVGNVAERDRDIRRKRERSAASKTVVVPACADPERRTRLEADDEAWLRWYFAIESGSENPFWYDFTDQQKEMIAAIRNAILHGGDQSIAASRGEGKTTYFERMLLKYTLQGLIRFAVLFAATGSAAQDSLESIKLEIENNDRLCADYPEVCVPVRALENTPQRAHFQLVAGNRPDDGEQYLPTSSRFSWCGQEIYLPKVPGSPSAGAIIATRGLDAAIRGVKKKGRRVDVACIDDPDTEETARSPEQAAKLEDRIDRAIAGLGSQQRRLARVMLTTIQNRTCVSYKYTDRDQKPSWKPKRFRFLVKKPDRADLWQEFVALKQADWVNGTNKAHELYLANRELMDAGASVANPNRHTPAEASALEFYYSEVARLGADAVATEYDNDPPADESTQRILLTPYHIQNNCLGGLEKREAPDETICITVGGDVQKLGLHWVAIAWNEHGAGSIIDYDFFPFLTEGRKAADCELLILEGLFAWHAAQEEIPYTTPTGEKLIADLTLIDQGWKEESWNIQPVQHFCAQVGFHSFIPSKGEPNYRRPLDSQHILIGDNWHVVFRGGIPLVMTNADHWKLKVHEGLLLDAGQPGALTLFNPARVDGRRNVTGHLNYSKHLLSETWETRHKPGFGGARTGWWKSPKPNHYFDATYQAICARSMRRISVLAPVATPPPPVEPYTPAAYYDPPAERRNRW